VGQVSAQRQVGNAGNLPGAGCKSEGSPAGVVLIIAAHTRADAQTFDKERQRRRVNLNPGPPIGLKGGSLPMDITLTVLADGANISREGKLNILGIFNTVHVQSFPGGLAQCFLVVRLAPDVEEKGTRQRIVFRLTDPDGKWVNELTVEMQVPAEGPPGSPETDLIIPAAPLVRFEREGPHELKIFINDEERRAIKLAAIRIPAPPGAPGQQP
jgi:Family of unknown function (DUF6941)